jgi:hypothetical protein
MAATLLLTSGAMVVVLVIMESLHLANPLHYGPPGGASHLAGFSIALSQLGGIAAIVIGAAAGAGDVAAGVFRSLVVTGRSRVALFLARVPAGLLTTVLVVALAYAIVVVALVALAGADITPTVGPVLRWGLWVELEAVMVFFVALSLSSLIGSRSITVGVLLAWQLVLTSILIGIRPLPDVRQAVLGVALEQLRPHDLDVGSANNVVMTTTAIAVVLVCWAAVPLALGAWRTATRDA